MNRWVKQFIIAFSYLVVFGSLGYGLNVLLTVEPTCTDGIKNQGEDGVDCGVIACGKLCDAEVRKLQTQSVYLVRSGAGTYDFVAKIINPNAIYGSARVPYDIEFRDAQGAVFGKESGTFFVLPSQTRYLVRLALQPVQEPQDVNLRLGSPEWKKISLQEIPVVNFSVKGEQYTDKGAGGGSEVEALLYNDSDFDFTEVDVNIIVFDEFGSVPIGVNTTKVRTLVSGTERYYKATWSAPLSLARPRIVTDATTNIFEPSNFIPRHGSREKSQQLNPGP